MIDYNYTLFLQHMGLTPHFCVSELVEENAQLRQDLSTRNTPIQVQIQVASWLPPGRQMPPGQPGAYTELWQQTAVELQYAFPQLPAGYLPFSPSQIPHTYPQIQQAPIRPQDLIYMLNVPETDQTDITEVLNAEYQTRNTGRSRANQIVTTNQFRGWILTPTSSSQLFIQGDFRSETTYYVSALSLFCATFSQALRTRERYISLVFFCGLHVEDYGNHSSPNELGVQAMIRSLISQLLRGYVSKFPAWFPAQGIATDVDLERARCGDIHQLCRLFGWLVRNLPEGNTVVCLIDGIFNYETDEYEEDMVAVMDYILRLSRSEPERSGSRGAALKVLVTSPLNTYRVQGMFMEIEEDDQEDSSILHMTGIPSVSHETSQLQFESQVHHGDLEEDGYIEEEF